MTSFASFLLVNQKLYGAKYGEHTSTQLFLLYFVVIVVQGFKQMKFLATLLCFFILLMKLSLKKNLHVRTYLLIRGFF